MKHKAFTLIEVLLVWGIIGILSAIAYPIYQHYMQRVYRHKAVLVLLQYQRELRNAYTHTRSYEQAWSAIHNIPKKLGHYYDITMGPLSQDYFEINALPLFDDPTCGALIYTSLGHQKITGTGNAEKCWAR